MEVTDIAAVTEKPVAATIDPDLIADQEMLSWMMDECAQYDFNEIRNV